MTIPDHPAILNSWQSHDGSATLLHGDCLALYDLIPKHAAIISDPPYGMNNDTDSSRFSGGQSPFITRGDNTPGPFTKPIHGDDAPFDPAPWVAFPSVVLWGSNHFSQRLEAGTTLVWIKKYDHLFGTFLSDAEVAWMKGGAGVYCIRRTGNDRSQPNRLHPNEKPLEVMFWCMEKAKVSASGLVCDPFMGSGTTGVACIRTGRSFIGIEIDESYFNIAVKRCKNELAQERIVFPEANKPTQDNLF